MHISVIDNNKYCSQYIFQYKHMSMNMVDTIAYSTGGCNVNHIII